MNAIEKNGPRIADLEFPVHSLFEGEDIVVAFRLTEWASGPAPEVEAYGRTSHFDKGLGDWADDTVLAPLDVSDVRVESDPSGVALVFRVRARVDCDPAVAIVAWKKETDAEDTRRKTGVMRPRRDRRAAAKAAVAAAEAAAAETVIAAAEAAVCDDPSF